MRSKIVGIGGGMGPMAGVKLHEKIVALTPARMDREHLDVFHFSCSSDIADRTQFYLTGEGENPAQGMFRKVKAIHEAAAIYQKEVVIGIPCNTFHIPVIFDVFVALVKKHYPNTTVIHMIEETVTQLNGIKKVGLLSTTGTRLAKVYHHLLADSGITIVEVEEEQQAQVQASIYSSDWGIKAQSPVTSKARNNFLNFCQQLKEAGAEAIILGCTEIPLALPEKAIYGTLLVDPVTILAQRLIQTASTDVNSSTMHDL